MITKEDIKAAKQRVDIAKSALEKLRVQYAHQECPLEVGQTIEVCGYSHQGKKMLIRGVGPAYYSFKGSWQVVGDIIKKSGQPGELSATVTQDDWERKNG